MKASEKASAHELRSKARVGISWKRGKSIERRGVSMCQGLAVRENHGRGIHYKVIQVSMIGEETEGGRRERRKRERERGNPVIWVM